MTKLNSTDKKHFGLSLSHNHAVVSKSDAILPH